MPNTPDREVPRLPDHDGGMHASARSSSAVTRTLARGRRAGDGIFPNISRKRAIEYLALIVAASTVYGMITTWVASRYATRAEIAPIVRRIDSVGVAVGSVSVRVDTLEALRRRDAENDRRMNTLFMGLVKLRCLEISEEKAFLVGLPCDSLLAPATRRSR